MYSSVLSNHVAQYFDKIRNFLKQMTSEKWAIESVADAVYGRLLTRKSGVEHYSEKIEN